MLFYKIHIEGTDESIRNMIAELSKYDTIFSKMEPSSVFFSALEDKLTT